MIRNHFRKAIFLSLPVICLTMLTLTALSNAASPDITPPPKVIKSHAIALRGTPTYPANFKHFDYVNPSAPKAGQLHTAYSGSFDNFNRYAQRGSAPIGIEYLFDPLMVSHADEFGVVYGLIAKEVEYADDYSWIIFHLNPQATFQDGKPITADDVVFSFQKFYDEGVPFFKRQNKGVTAEKLSDSQVKFILPQKEKSRLLGIAGLIVLPQHHYKDINLSNPLDTPPMGSGPYTVGDFKMGQTITYQRAKNYWAKNHPTRAGFYNFDSVRIDYYLDETVLMEAFKKGEYDLRLENTSKNWATQYNGKNFDKGYIVREEIPDQSPHGNQCFIFNIERPQFQDRRVREALNYLFDFEWTNKNLFYGAYTRNYSYFMGTPYGAEGLPSPAEQAILKPFAKSLPPQLFTKTFALNKTDGSGKNRKALRQALKLFKAAGYQVRDKKLVDKQGKPFEFEVVLYSPAFERIVLPIQKNLEKLGGKLNIRMVSDSAQYVNRLRERKYDMIVNNLGGGAFPSEHLKLEWHSDFLDSTYNAVGTQSKVLDHLVEKIIENQEHDANLLNYGRALDRVLLWEFYTLPHWHSPNHRVAYWNKFSRPKKTPKYDLDLDTWWYDSQKAQGLPNLAQR